MEKISSASGIVLAIETGISGGSLSLLKNGKQVGYWTGNQNLSRAEDVLAEINKLLRAGGVEKQSLNLIAVSNGPGSFTGLRIGAAIALGLRKSIGCVLSAQPILESMRLAFGSGKNTICAVPFGKNQMCWQYFVEENRSVSDTIPAAKIIVSEAAALPEDWQHLDFEKVILHEKLFGSLNVSAEIMPNQRLRKWLNREKIECADKNLAVLIGLKAIAVWDDDERINPNLIYPARS